MPNLVEVNYEQTGASKSTNEFGMRDMQEKAYEQRDAKYLLLKAPPASGKSRALMFIALDKLINQGVKKVIVAVPERAIGGSFGSTNLKQFGFFANWDVNEKYNLCTTEDKQSTVEAFKEFLGNNEKVLICTHTTLRLAFDQLNELKFNDTLLAIDEFHHVSSDRDNRLGEVLRTLIEKSSLHIVAMTGSYFRGDSVPVLLPEDEAKFTKVTYNYYEQLNGYEYLKSLGIGYHFYQGRYTTAIKDILDTDKKTILHIPNVNSGESTKDKHREVGTILDIIGRVKEVTDDGVIILKRHTDGKLLKVADLVNDEQSERDKIITYLRNIRSEDDMDLIIALGMAKEGFDWPYCEHALTVGYRSSLTEIIQIIGRATRDSENKTTAQFTNLIAQPDAHNDEVKLSVNNMLKAITSSLLMEQVLAPSFKFKPKFENDKEPPKKGELKIRGFKEPSSKKVKDIVDSDLNDLKASILQDPQMLKAMPGNIEPEVINEVLIPKIIKVKYPDLDETEVKELSQYVVIDSVVRNATIETNGDKKFIRMADKFINLDDLNIDLINSINPFQQAFEILSKQVTTGVLKIIQEAIAATRIKMDFEEASILWPKIQEFIKEHGREPDINSADGKEQRMAECIIYLKEEKRKRAN
ncbi:MAG: helicase-related protein [Campylobacterota bacterium]|nr:helicase-related protein [Campylobacterota bacterium]